MSTEKIETIDGYELLKMELPPIRFIVDRFLPQGFHILAGAPKTGKSWLLLHLCLQVASGERFWNLRTEQGTVLYLCLEDNNVRVQERLSELTETGCDKLHFATLVNPLSSGLVEQLELFISEHPDTVLIVIDTLQKIREATVDGGMYASDYKDISVLKRLADKHGIAIIGVQHLRKQYSSDPHQMISGSTGLVGAADGSYILVKERNGGRDAALHIRGRDIEECIFSLNFNGETMVWDFISSDSPQSEELKNDIALKTLIAFIKIKGSYTGTASGLVERLDGGIKANSLTRKLKKHEHELRELGIVFEKTRSGERREISIRYENLLWHDDMTV